MVAAAVLDFDKLLSFLNYLTIVTKIIGNLRTSIWNISMMSKMHCSRIQDGGRPRVEFRKTVAISLLFDQSSPNLV